jgi:UPF0176 protein
MTHKILAYYYIGNLADPHGEVALHKEFLSKLDFKGRIYISEQGINGQSSGRLGDAEIYMEWLSKRYPVEFKIHEAPEHAFEKMIVKYRKQLVAVDCNVDFSKRGESVSPDVWNKMLKEKDENTLVLDVRNDYEWKIGHFEGSELPALSTFREFPEYARKLKESRDPSNTCVMMYCTGGIRCEFFSAIMKEEGFEKIYQLDGGVIQYGLQTEGEEWRGKLFVFDDRLAVDVGDAKEPISECTHCGTANDVYYNCANMDCNELFLCCPDCLKEKKGCCSAECETAPRLRPFRETGNKPFRKWNSSTKQN